MSLLDSGDTITDWAQIFLVLIHIGPMALCSMLNKGPQKPGVFLQSGK